jgi:hypothetical protein
MEKEGEFGVRGKEAITIKLEDTWGGRRRGGEGGGRGGHL